MIPFHVVQLGNQALDVVRRGYWNELRDRAGRDDARRFRHARWALLKRPEDLSNTQTAQLARESAGDGRPRRHHRQLDADGSLARAFVGCLTQALDNTERCPG